MIYRVHRPHKANGSFGALIGYICLCNVLSKEISHICETLKEANIVPKEWFASRELQAVPENSPIYGAPAYSILRRPPSRDLLFYIYPIESKKIKKEDIPLTWTSHYINNASTVGTGDWNGVYSGYSISYTNNAYRLIQRAADQIDQEPPAPPHEDD